VVVGVVVGVMMSLVVPSPKCGRSAFNRGNRLARSNFTVLGALAVVLIEPLFRLLLRGLPLLWVGFKPRFLLFLLLPLFLLRQRAMGVLLVLLTRLSPVVMLRFSRRLGFGHGIRLGFDWGIRFRLELGTR